jgi:site-specific DNA-methyltransferase (adenine-specific)
VSDWTLHTGDCLFVLPTLEAESVDSIVTDPPYHLTARPGAGGGFMSLPWDGGDIAFRPEVWRECLRVAKPGASLLAFGGTRTWHRLACAVEDAGWELRDTLLWLHGQGFPKGKACLKPAWEPILLARKPGPHVLPLNVNGCRIGTGADKGVWPATARDDDHQNWRLRNGNVPTDRTVGRYPANVVLSHHPSCVRRGTKRVKGSNGVRGASTRVYGGGEGFTAATGEPVGYADADGTEAVEDWDCHEDCPVFLLDSEAGERKSGGMMHDRSPRIGRCYGDDLTPGTRGVRRGPDAGGPSRFFTRLHYCGKASQRERGEGNGHKTVKPLALMRWLCRLTKTPTGGVVLDPFAGSGTTLLAALLEGRRAIGVEVNEGYAAVARKRLAEAEGPLFAHARERTD